MIDDSFEAVLLAVWWTGVGVVLAGILGMIFGRQLADRFNRWRYRPAFIPAPLLSAARPTHHALSWRREVADWLLQAAADALVNTAIISKGLPA